MGQFSRRAMVIVSRVVYGKAEGKGDRVRDRGKKREGYE